MPGDFLDTSALAKHYHTEVGSDALQLAVALDLRRKKVIDRVVSADKDLLAVAAVEGLNTFDPENP